MNTINKNIIKALYESTSKPTFPSSIKKASEEFLSELEDCNFKNNKDVEYFMDAMIEFGEDYIYDAAKDVYADYVFYTVDDSDYDREYGYGKNVSVEFEKDSANVNKKLIKDLAIEMINDYSNWLKTKEYNISPELIAKYDDNKDLLEKKFPDYLVKYFEYDYIDTYIDGIEPGDDIIAYQK